MIIIITIIVVTHFKKTAQNHFVSDVLGVLTGFGSSNIILALPIDPTKTFIPAADPAVKIRTAGKITQYTPQKKKKLNATANEFLKWYWPMRNDLRHFPPSRGEL